MVYLVTNYLHAFCRNDKKLTFEALLVLYSRLLYIEFPTYCAVNSEMVKDFRCSFSTSKSLLYCQQ